MLPRTPPALEGTQRGPQGTRTPPDNFGSAAGGFTQAPGGWAGPELERVEFPAFDLPTVTRAKLHIQRRSLANDVLVPGWSFRYHII